MDRRGGTDPHDLARLTPTISRACRPAACSPAAVEGIALRIMRNRWGRPLDPVSPAQFERRAAGAASGEILVSARTCWQLSAWLRRQQTKVRIGDRVWHRTGTPVSRRSGRLC